MALTTTQQQTITKAVVGVFNAAPGVAYMELLAPFADNQSGLIAALVETDAFKAIYPTILTNTQFATRLLDALVGNTVDATNKGNIVTYVATLLDGGASRGNVVNALINALDNVDPVANPTWANAGKAFDNKVAVAQYYTVDKLGSSTSVTALQSVIATVTPSTDVTSTDAMDAAIAGVNQSFMLTTGVDTVAGTAGNDTIKGVLDTGTTTTINSLDEINGGAGTDTFQISTSKTGAIDLPSLTSVEVVEVKGTQDVQIDTSAAAGVTNLNIVKAGNDGAGLSVAATAAATTDVKVDMTSGAGTIGVVGGNNVTVKLAKATNADEITIGTGTAPKGDVVVETTGAAFNKAAQTLADVTVTGGKTVTVTQKSTSDASAAAADTAAKTAHGITQGAITVNANADTTTVTIKQDATATGADAANSTGGVTETVSVKFKDLAATKTVVLGGLTLTAVEDMTAAQVAQAFANLAAGAATPTNTAVTTADGDTQSAATSAKATYSGSINGWTTGAANGDTVVFTYTANTATGGSALADGGNGLATALTLLTTGKAHDATPTGGVLKTTAGTVKIVGDAALATVTVDGYTTTATGTDGVTGTSNTALATVNLSNGADFGIESAGATLALNATNVNGKIDVKAGTKTLNAAISNTGSASTALKSASATTVNITGSGQVAGNNTDLSAVTAIATTSFTGTATFTIDGTATTYTGGAGVDKVAVAADAIVSKAIDLGAGNDRLDLSAVVTKAKAPTAALTGGDGTDTLVLDADASDSVAGLSSDKTFVAKIAGFEQLELAASVNGSDINLANLGFTSYVITNGVANTKTLTLDKLAANATVELAAATGNTGTIEAKLADATGTADVLNLVTKVSAANADFGTLKADGVETLNLNAVDTVPVTSGAASIDTATLAISSDKATTLNVTGNSDVSLTITAAAKLATIDAHSLTGALTVSANGGIVTTITGGSGADTLAASVGATAKADVINGGAGNDVITAGSNGAELTGGAGNDTFILTASSVTTGSKEANTYSTIKDFQAGDVLQLQWFNGDLAGAAAATQDVTSFAKLAANLNDSTAVFSDFVNAAMGQINANDGVTPGATADSAGGAVYFNFKGDAYVVVDSGAATDGTFANTEDLVIKLVGVNGDNLSFNSTFATVAL